MASLQWYELDFLECLGVVPVVNDEDGGYSYKILRDDIELLLTVWDWRNAVALTLQRIGAQNPLISLVVYVRGEVRYRREKWGEYLEFRDCVCAPEGRFSDAEVFSQQFVSVMNLQLFVQPDIHIKFE